MTRTLLDLRANTWFYEHQDKSLLNYQPKHKRRKKKKKFRCRTLHTYSTHSEIQNPVLFTNSDTNYIASVTQFTHDLNHDECTFLLFDDTLRVIDRLNYKNEQFEDLKYCDGVFAASGDNLRVWRLRKFNEQQENDERRLMELYTVKLTLKCPARVALMNSFIAITKLVEYEISILQYTSTHLKPLLRLDGHDKRSIRCLHTLDKPNVIASIAGDIRIWDIRSGHCEHVMESRRGLYDICATHGSQHILVGECANNKCHLFDLRKDSIPITSVFHFGLTNCVLTDRYFISSSLQRPTGIVWDLYSGKALCTIDGWSASSMSVSQNGEDIVLSESRFQNAKECGDENMPQLISRIRKLQLQQRVKDRNSLYSKYKYG